MGSFLSCLPQKEVVARVDVVAKIGGSACTQKTKFETLNEPALLAISEQLGAMVRNGQTVALVHGAGSFGHKQAREYGISKGNAGSGRFSLTDNLREGFAKTRLSVTTLNKYVVAALLKAGVPAVTMSPCPFVDTAGKKLRGGRLPVAAREGVASVLLAGMVPVVHGDAVLDNAQGCTILSGDIWMVELSRELRAKRVVFVTDVDGVFTKPPSEAGAQLIKEILVCPVTGELELTGVEMTCDTGHDVTGGLKEKLRCVADVLKGAPSVDAVYIVRAGSEAASAALKGQAMTSGTVLRRKAAR